jgi:FtsZ-binding cell division protein ZapB
MAAERPIPPFLPDTVEDFLTNVNDNPTPWVEYLRKAHEYINTAPLPLELDTSELYERLSTQDSEIAYLKEKNNTLKTELLRHQTIIEFQRQEVDRYNDKLRRAEIDRDRAVAQAIAPILLRERLRLLLPHLPSILCDPTSCLTPTSLQAIERTSADSYPK